MTRAVILTALMHYGGVGRFNHTRYYTGDKAKVYQTAQLTLWELRSVSANASSIRLSISRTLRKYCLRF